ncbi:hypothetical protein BOTBODRAFT_169540 [Botryobasidium botryosum FD-172 SS1]|uniref:HTH CENPB-type domain-containing protein n=1 Tax=Botryobasidium botryosum (strain FD-172 SS1) TaxID=930990 RepID=A0A067NAR0_BOTB1|nr:hypothetical protein BOTBODRAFT_169540 [Botryobasidium botryosum FD-172 SS1]
MYALVSAPPSQPIPSSSQDDAARYIYDQACLQLADSGPDSSVYASSTSHPELDMGNWPSHLGASNLNSFALHDQSLPAPPSFLPSDTSSSSEGPGPHRSTRMQGRRASARATARSEGIVTRNRAATLSGQPSQSQMYSSQPQDYSDPSNFLRSPFNQSQGSPQMFSSDLAQLGYASSFPLPAHQSQLHTPQSQHHGFPSPPNGSSASSSTSYPSGRSCSPANSIASTALTSLSGGGSGSASGGVNNLQSSSSQDDMDQADSDDELSAEPSPLHMHHSHTHHHLSGTSSVGHHHHRKVTKAKTKLSDMDRKFICIYAEKHPKSRQEDIATKFSVERSTVSKILKQRDKWMKVDMFSQEARVIKHRPSKFPEIETRLASWVRDCVRDKIVLTDALIRERARECARSLGIGDDKFKASSGWVENFKHRNSIRRGTQWLRPEQLPQPVEMDSSSGSNASVSGNGSSGSEQGSTLGTPPEAHKELQGVSQSPPYDEALPMEQPHSPVGSFYQPGLSPSTSSTNSPPVLTPNSHTSALPSGFHPSFMKHRRQLSNVSTASSLPDHSLPPSPSPSATMFTRHGMGRSASFSGGGGLAYLSSPMMASHRRQMTYDTPASGALAEECLSSASQQELQAMRDLANGQPTASPTTTEFNALSLAPQTPTANEMSISIANQMAQVSTQPLHPLPLSVTLPQTSSSPSLANVMHPHQSAAQPGGDNVPTPENAFHALHTVLRFVNDPSYSMYAPSQDGQAALEALDRLKGRWEGIIRDKVDTPNGIPS